MARTTQAAKPRHDDLDTFGRRDGSVWYRDATRNPKKNLDFPTRQQLRANDAGRDGLYDENEYQSPEDLEMIEGADEYFRLIGAELVSDGTLSAPFDDEDDEAAQEELMRRLMESSSSDPYRRNGGAFVIDNGYYLGGAVFGETAAWENGGYSIRTRP